MAKPIMKIMWDQINEEDLEQSGTFRCSVDSAHLVENPLICQDCNQTVCETCYKDFFRCPFCKSTIKSELPSFLLEVLNMIRLKCENWVRGCPEELLYQNYRKHVESCRYANLNFTTNDGGFLKREDETGKKMPESNQILIGNLENPKKISNLFREDSIKEKKENDGEKLQKKDNPMKIEEEFSKPKEKTYLNYFNDPHFKDKMTLQEADPTQSAKEKPIENPKNLNSLEKKKIKKQIKVEDDNDDDPKKKLKFSLSDRKTQIIQKILECQSLGELFSTLKRQTTLVRQNFEDSNELHSNSSSEQSKSHRNFFHNLSDADLLKFKENDFDQLTMDNLKSLLENRSLSKAGNKNDLILKLSLHLMSVREEKKKGKDDKKGIPGLEKKIKKPSKVILKIFPHYFEKKEREIEKKKQSLSKFSEIQKKYG